MLSFQPELRELTRITIQPVTVWIFQFLYRCLPVLIVPISVPAGPRRPIKTARKRVLGSIFWLPLFLPNCAVDEFSTANGPGEKLQAPGLSTAKYAKYANGGICRKGTQRTQRTQSRATCRRSFFHMLSGNLASQARHELVSPRETIALRNVVRELAGTGLRGKHIVSRPLPVVRCYWTGRQGSGVPFFFCMRSVTISDN
jgi:hypothetical protein